jgi:putative oxidoreductase
MFPRGGPGIGLLFLRLSVAATTLHACSSPESLAAWVLVALVVVSATLCIGALTPFAAVLAVALQLRAATSVSVVGSGMVVTAVLDALALAVLGPGAYSLDAHRFGRREVILLPPRDRESG